MYHLTERDKEIQRFIYRDWAMRHKKCNRCKWADSRIMPDCRLKMQDVSYFQRIRAKLCKFYEPSNPE